MFPLGPLRLAGSDWLWNNCCSIRSLVEPDRLLDQNPSSALPLQVNFRLYLDIFRGEPAISEFVRHITSNHISSQVIDTTTGSGLPHDVSRGSPWTWIAHSVSGLSHPVNGLLTLAFTTLSPQNGLSKKDTVTHRFILQYARDCRSKPPLSLLVNIRFQVLFHWAFRSSFHLSLAVLVHYRSESIFSLSGWSRRIHTGLHVSCATRVFTKPVSNFVYRTITFFGVAFQRL